jgi:hypothetical protein
VDGSRTCILDLWLLLVLRLVLGSLWLLRR